MPGVPLQQVANNNGNLTQKTDPHSVVTRYEYEDRPR
ncbi:MAG: hypothetical protein HYR55_00830 [Acidobacteria bacterium]|nr:hypothetical protein [Acidobacteriota bacterium]MBI3656061.1 hypothetical protein [Acidobacteriota bacterium]